MENKHMQENRTDKQYVTVKLYAIQTRQNLCNASEVKSFI